MDVKLRVYKIATPEALDLLNKCLNKNFEGIWHTSLEIYGKEIFFSNDVIKTLPGMSGHLILHETIHMGQTDITEDEFELYLKTLEDQFGKNTYNILHNNCNHFTDTCMQFLVNKKIPSYILEVHEAAIENDMVSKMVEMFFKHPNSKE